MEWYVLLGGIVGAVVGAEVYHWLQKRKKKQQK